MAAHVSRASLSERERVIYDVYYDSKTGFQSMPATYKAAREKDVSIAREEVKKFLKKQAVVQDQSQKGPRFNSFVAREPREEFQGDLADFGQRQDPRFGLICVDIFTKKLAVVPFQNKLPKSTSDAFQEVIDKMDVPSSIVTGDEGQCRATARSTHCPHCPSN